MRIISQDGHVNISFETNKFYSQEKEYSVNDEAHSYWIIRIGVNQALAIYSTKEKALKVMKMIWQPRHWVSSNALIKDCDFVPGFERYVFYMPKDDDVK